MVFFYTIRGGPCKGELSHITLREEDICCYVGRDKYENEELIAYGWPGDIWFHVDNVSSAHVYFRLNYDVAAAFHGNDQIPLTGAIPMHCLPDNSVEDMMQIVKHNSIEGSKMASAKIVWTPHFNLKKNFDMAAGQVTYHDTKLCRYGRCHKDRVRIKTLEKTKSIDRTDIDLYQAKKNNERALIERRKHHRKHASRKGTSENDGLFDPIEADRKLTLHKNNRQGDELSGIDQGVALLETLLLGDPLVHHGSSVANGSASPNSKREHGDDIENIPVWRRQYIKDEQEYRDDEMALFLLERGYPRTSVDRIVTRERKPKSNIEALLELWNSFMSSNETMPTSSPVGEEELLTSRQEEREVLDAIFGEDIEWFSLADTNEKNQEMDPKSLLDSSVPVTNYEPPGRYFLGDDPPPELRLEIYASPTNYPFNGRPPVMALLGGGIPQVYLHKMTLHLFQEAQARAAEEDPGGPIVFTLITFIGEIWEAIVQEEGAAATKELQQAKVAKLQELRQQQQQVMLDGSGDNSEIVTATVTGSMKFASEQERRAYAATVVAQDMAGHPSANNIATKSEAGKGRQYHDTTVTNQSLIDDLFS